GTPFIQNANTSPASLTVNNPGNFTGTFDVFAGTLRDGAGGGALSLVKSGFGGLTLSGNNTFTGGVILTGSGVLQIGSTAALNSSNPNAVTFAPGSSTWLDLSGHSITLGGLNSNGGGRVLNLSTIPATLTINNPSDISYTGSLENISLTK